MSKHKRIHAVELSGTWFLMGEPFYEANNVLDADDVGEDQAKENAERISVLWNAMEGLTNEEVEQLRSKPDAAVMPVAFAEYVMSTECAVFQVDNRLTISELCKYWIENVYKP